MYLLTLQIGSAFCQTGRQKIAKIIGKQDKSKNDDYDAWWPRARIRHQCNKTTVLSCYRCLINTGVEKMSNILIWIRTLTAGCL